jgi:8-oxo-dGTP pyrophosphatase MutT (NUDIX family)
MTLSELSDRLQRSPSPDINGREEYLQTAVIALLVGEGDDLALVFEKRNANIRQGGEICFPGGRYDPRQDSTFRNTALRETSEELGIPVSSITVFGSLDTVLAPMGTLVEAFVGHTTLESAQSAQPGRSGESFHDTAFPFPGDGSRGIRRELRLFPKTLNPSTGERRFSSP